MEEQLINFKTAKLAKEKGFNEDTKYRFTTDHAVLDLGELMEYPKCYCHPEDDYCECGFCEELKHWSSYIPAPTQSLLQKWLREKHHLIIIIAYQYEHNSTPYSYWIYKENNSLPINQWVNDLNTYEEALEASLQKALSRI